MIQKSILTALLVVLSLVLCQTPVFADTSSSGNNPVKKVFETGNEVKGTPPDIRTPITLTFPDTYVGEEIVFGVDIYNDGQTLLTINSIKPQFSDNVSRYNGPSTPFNIMGPNGYKTVTVTFAPSAVGSFTRTYNVNSNDPDEPNVPLTITGKGITPNPQIYLPIDPIIFPDTRYGETKNAGTRISSCGALPLQIYDIVREEGDAEFYYDGQKNFQIPVGVQIVIYIKYAPRSGTSHHALFAVYSNDPITPRATFEVSGTAIRGPAIGQPIANIDFGRVKLGTTSDKTIVIRNEGNRVLTISKIECPSIEFSYIGPSLPFNVNQGYSQEITVRFSPAQERSRSTTFTVYSNDLLYPIVTFNASGYGAGNPLINLDPLIIEFGNVPINTTQRKALTIYNKGSDTLNINSIDKISGSSNFSCSPVQCTIEPDDKREITVEFTPGQVGPLEAVFSVKSNDQMHPTEFTAKGTGTQIPKPIIVVKQEDTIIFNGGVFDFGPLKVGTMSCKTFSIINYGTADLILNGSPVIPMSGTNKDQFNIPQQPPTAITIIPGSSISFVICFAPTTEGYKEAYISITSNDVNNSPYSIKLTGEGIIDPVDVKITNPIADSIVKGVVEIQATASSGLGVKKVLFYIDGQEICNDTTEPFSCTWDSQNAKNGRHTIQAVVYDNGDRTDSDSISVYVDNQANNPWINSIDPTSGPVSTPVTINGVNFGSNPGTITFNGINAATGSWTVTQIKTSVPAGATTGNVIVHTYDSKDSNGVPFTVDTTKTLAVTFPNGGEVWKVGLTYTITWTATDNIGNVKIEYSVNNGVNWKPIANSIPNTKSYPWTVPNEVSSQCLVRVSATDGSISDTSNSVFSIVTESTNKYIKVGALTLYADSVSQSGSTYTLSGNVNIDGKLWFSGNVIFTGNPGSGIGTLTSIGYPFMKLSSGSKAVFSGTNFSFDIDGNAGTLMPKNLNLVYYALTLVNMPLEITEEPITIVSEGVQIEPNLYIGNGDDFNLCAVRLQLVYKPYDGVYLKKAEVEVGGENTISYLKAVKVSLLYDGVADELTGTATLNFPYLGIDSIEATVRVIKGCFNGFDIIIALEEGIPLGSTGLEILGLTLKIDNLCNPLEFYIFFGGDLGINGIPDNIFVLEEAGLAYENPFRFIIKGGTAKFLDFPFFTVSGYIDASGDQNKTGGKFSGTLDFAGFYKAEVNLQLLAMLLKFNGSATGILQIPDFDCGSDAFCKIIKAVLEKIIPLPYPISRQQMDIDFSNTNGTWKGQLRGMISLGPNLNYAVALVYEHGQLHFYIGNNYKDMTPLFISGEMKIMKGSIEQSITLPSDKEEIVFAAIGKTSQPEIYLKTPGGVTITSNNVGNFTGVSYIENSENLVTLFKFEKPAAGNWTLGVSNLPSSQVTMKVLSKMQLPQTSFTQVNRSGNTVNISSSVNSVGSGAKVSYYFSERVSSGDGSPIAENLTVNNGIVSTKWDISKISTGKYYIFSKTSDESSVPVLTYYTSPIIIDKSGIEPPTDVHGSRTGSSVNLTWNPSASNSIIGYNVLYTDLPDVPGYKFQKMSTSNNQAVINDLDPQMDYRFCVVAVDSSGNFSLESNTYQTSGKSNTDVWVLENGVSVSENITPGKWKYYNIDIPNSTRSLVIKTSNSTGNLDLYIRSGGKPSFTQYDYRACTSTGNETLTINSNTSKPSLTPGSWYIGVIGIDNSSFSITADYILTIGQPKISMNRESLTFGALANSLSPLSQKIIISNASAGTLNWTAAADQSWLNLNPPSSNDWGVLTVSVDVTGLTVGTYTGTITISDPNATNSPQSVIVNLTVYNPESTSLPFGEFSTPIDGSTVSSSIPVTGWVLDDIGVENVKIYREENGNLVYIGDSVFVEGARPDVELAYPGYPMNYQAGWGYMLLTNFLPNGGNGTFKLHVIATDTEGHQATLGTKTITCDNAHAVKPFGAIDSPLQGGDAYGTSFRNQGWVLTPRPNHVPEDGSTVKVWIDGLYRGNAKYNIYREDIARLFPGYVNSYGALGYFDFDTTAYSNGIHTICWTVEDNAGNSDGIGSRYFKILNVGALSSKEEKFTGGTGDTPAVNDYPQPVFITTGYKENSSPMPIFTDENNNVIQIHIPELERVEIHLGSALDEGYMLAGEELRPLAAGSTLDTVNGIFYWWPGPGFIGKYDFEFVITNSSGEKTKKRIQIVINPMNPKIKE